MSNALIARFQQARRDPGLAVLEGLHALKHALRFGAQVECALVGNVEELRRLSEDLAPELSDWLARHATPVEAEVIERLAPKAPRTGVVAIARRPKVEPRAVLDDPRLAPVVLLERPRDLGNMGACVRVAAAVDAAGVLTTGHNDPWHPDALRGAAGLHYAVPVARVGELPDSDRPLIAVDPEGEPLALGSLPGRAILAFGSERYGVSEEVMGGASACVSIPMRSGVSSLNLATSVAVVLFAARAFGGPAPECGDPDAGGPASVEG